MQSSLARLDTWIRDHIAPYSLRVHGPSEDVSRDVHYWVVGLPPSSHHLIEVSKEAVEDGTDLVEAARQISGFGWPGLIVEHFGKAYRITGEGRVSRRDIADSD